MDLRSSPSYLLRRELSDTSTKSQEDHMYAKYMRFSSSPDSNSAQHTMNPLSEEASSRDELESHDDYDDLGRHEETPDDNLLVQVPLSSSPLDFTSSSPRSCSLGSQDSETYSTPTPISSDLDPEANIMSRRQLNVSNVDLSESSGVNDFTQRLHCFLLAVLEERRRLKTSSPCLNESGSQDGFLSDRSRSFVSTSSDAAGDEVDELNIDCNGQSTSVVPDDENSSSAHIQTYRIIKRARSNISYEPAENSMDGPTKRQKTRNDGVSAAKPRIYAHRTASLRRAESLKGVYIHETKAVSCVDTVPATPAPESSELYSGNSHRVANKESNKRVIERTVPIIAPPLGHSVGFTLNTEQLAKRRLFTLLEREQDGHERDGLYLRICRGPGTLPNARYEAPFCLESNPTCLTSEWEVALGLGRQDREEAVEWLLEVMPESASRTSSPSTSVSTIRGSTLSSTTSESPGGSFDSSQYTPPCRSTPSTPTSVNRAPAPSSSLSNLEDQLAHSPNTRFHAVWMLLRYFHLCMKTGHSNQSGNSGVSRTSSVNPIRSDSINSQGLNLVLWDVTVGCLSISVKFHRDFLNPLLPVFAHEYLTLAPHQMSYEDLETAHRDILSAFDYRLGVTPQPIMDELWLALPSLRVLLHFDGGREHASSHTWTILFTALDEPDVLRFPVSMLTIVALMEGVVHSLTVYKHGRWMMKTERYHDDQGPHLSGLALRTRFRKKAREESEGILCDIQALTGITDVELRECRAWIRNLD